MNPLAVFALAFSVLAFWDSAGAADADKLAVASQPLPVAWDKSATVLGAAKTMTYSGTVQDAAGQPTLLVKATPVAGVK